MLNCSQGLKRGVNFMKPPLFVFGAMNFMLIPGKNASFFLFCAAKLQENQLLPLSKYVEEDPPAARFGAGNRECRSDW